MTPPKISVTGKLRHARTIQVEDFRFVAEHTDRTPKVAIPSPTMVHFRGGRGGIDIESYPDLDEFFDDLAQCYRDEIGALYAAGCRYLQLDDTNLAYLCDPVMRQGAVDRGDDPDELPRTYAALINHALDQRPDDLTVGIHLCRGNFRSTHFASGELRSRRRGAVQRDRRRCVLPRVRRRALGRLRAVALLPRRQDVGARTRHVEDGAELEDKDLLRARIHEAAEYVDLDRMCLSPQCGFSSTIHGNEITEDDQWAKLRHVVEVAESVWN